MTQPPTPDQSGAWKNTSLEHRRPVLSWWKPQEQATAQISNGFLLYETAAREKRVAETTACWGDTKGYLNRQCLFRKSWIKKLHMNTSFYDMWIFFVLFWNLINASESKSTGSSTTTLSLKHRDNSELPLDLNCSVLHMYESLFFRGPLSFCI